MICIYIYYITIKGCLMSSVNWSRMAHIIFCLFSITALVYIFFRYTFMIFLPFVLAWLFALMINPLAKSISKHFRIPKKLCSAILMLAFFAVLGGLVWLAVNRLAFESERLIIYFGREKDSIIVSIKTFFEKMTDLKSKIPLIDGLFEMEELDFLDGFDNMIENSFSNLAQSISKELPVIVGKIISAAPKVLFFIIVTIVASFYFCLGLEDIYAGILKCLPNNVSEKIRKIKNGFFKTAVKYIRAYLLLMLITFCELFIGLSILSVEYAFILALIISFVDLLPVFGTGTVLIPWAIVSFAIKDIKMGIGLLIVYGAMLVVRQFIEPKIIGKSLGLHPLLTLCAIYAGFRLFGILGMLIGPFVALIAKQIICSFEKNGEVSQ